MVDSSRLRILSFRQMKLLFTMKRSDTYNQTPFLMFEDSSGERYSYNKHSIRLSMDTFFLQITFSEKRAVSGLKFLMSVDVFEGEPKKPLEIKIPLSWGN
jgi:hypothetical protein